MRKMRTTFVCKPWVLLLVNAIAQKFFPVVFRTISLQVRLGPFLRCRMPTRCHKSRTEYAKSSNRVGNLQTTTPESLYGLHSTPLPSIFSALLGRAPIVSQTLPYLPQGLKESKIYLALFAMINPSAFSVTSFAILQQYSANLQLSLQYLLNGLGQFRKECQQISSLYDSLKMPPALSEGSLEYPPCPRSELEKGPSRGMSFDLRCVQDLLSRVV